MPFIKFSLLRLGVALAWFAAALFAGAGILISSVSAILVSWCVGYLLFPKLRLEAAAYLQRRYDPAKPHRMKTETEDSAAEDAFVEEQEQEQTGGQSGSAVTPGGQEK